MFDIASFLGMGQQQPQPQAPNPVMPTNEARPADLATQWNAYLQDPNVRATMLSAGLAMMRPNWGGPGQAIVSGIGAGAETLGDRQAAQQQLDRQAEQDAISAEGRKSSQKNQEANRANALEIAKMNNDTRLSLGNLRAGSAGGGGAGRNTQLGYFKELVKNARDPITGEMPEGITEEQLFERAAQMAAADRGNAGIKTPGVAQNNGGTGGSSLPGTGSATPGNTQKSPSQMNMPIRTATNPKTGEKMIYKDGKWQKM